MDSNTYGAPLSIPNIPKLSIGKPIGTIAPANIEKLNYEEWSSRMKNFLTQQGVWNVIEGSFQPQNTEVDYEAWKMRNRAALNAIQGACEEPLRDSIQGISSAKIAWDKLAKMHEEEAAGLDPFKDISVGTFNLGDLSKLEGLAEFTIPSFHGTMRLFKIDNNRFRSLHVAINKGDWDAVKCFLDHNEDALTAKITEDCEMPIHTAVRAGQVKITKELVLLMDEMDLEIQTALGNTALHYAALSGNVETIECMIQKNKNLARIANVPGIIPVNVACGDGHEDATHYLYSCTPFDLFNPENGSNGATLLIGSITSRMFDIALDLLRRYPSLTTARNFEGQCSIEAFFQLACAFPSGCELPFFKKWVYFFLHVQLPRAPNEYILQNRQNQQQNFLAQVITQWHGLASIVLKFLGVNRIYEMKLTHVCALKILRLMGEAIAALEPEDIPTDLLADATFKAVRNGMVEFVVEMIKSYPYLMHYGDILERNILANAVAYRQEKVFSLVYGLDARKRTWCYNRDCFRNNPLHLAGMMAPPTELSRISGAALQMQRELQWFQEVESILLPNMKENLNDKRETPKQVFTREHKQLVKDGEKWMKGTANSCTVVGALIITITFAVAFTVPGGNDQDTGYPIFLYKKPFDVFIISDAISLFFSSTSVLMFLGILTSRYSEDDFLISLPTKLIIGLSTLFLSIATMMLAFCAALIIMMNQRLRIVIPIVFLATLPVTLFAILQFRLLVEVFKSTYGSGIFNRKMKLWL